MPQSDSQKFMGSKHQARYAVIDIGTNSVLMLICDVGTKGQKFKVVLDTKEITRLGHGLPSTNQLHEEAMERTRATIREYAAQAQLLGVEQIVAVGTSALREATNASEFVHRVKDDCDLDIEIISGETEARCAYLSIRSDEHFRFLNESCLMVVDIGGGSTEIVLGQQEVNASVSVNVGAVYLTETFLKSDLPTDEELGALNDFLEETWLAQPILRANVQSPPALVGIGGTIVNLVSIKLGLNQFDPEPLHGKALDRAEIARQIRRFCSLPLNDRKQIPGLEAKRADVIIAGAAILQSILKHLGASQIRASTHGLRYGVMYDRFAPTRGSAPSGD